MTAQTFVHERLPLDLDGVHHSAVQTPQKNFPEIINAADATQNFVQQRLPIQLNDGILSGEWVEVLKPANFSTVESIGAQGYPELVKQVTHQAMQLFRGLVEMTPTDAADSPNVRQEADGTFTKIKSLLPVWRLSNVRLVLGREEDGSIIEIPRPDLYLSPTKQEFMISKTDPPEDYVTPTLTLDDSVQ